MFLLILT
ncbi:hypothetical protein CGLO_17992 [Colletotrichum gloeosporioides Cg-14]|nr:hypothetical protein CGLO_17992 [Colletotrichum gloeosporioides Cg-14]